MKTTIVNKTKEPCDVYIGRGSKWGNPYSHLHNTKAEFKVNSREDALRSYYLYISEGKGKHLQDDLHELEGKVLGCYCKPKKCHGDILIDLIMYKKWENLYI